MTTQLWSPDKDRISRSSITKLSRIVSSQTGLNISTYEQLHAWSIKNPGEFWGLVWDEAGIIGDKGEHFFTQGEDFISSEFFADAKLNVTETLLHKGHDDKVAIISILEDGARREITWRQLRVLVAATSTAMLREGVGPGDRVAAWAPNVAEVVIFTLAALRIGAIVSTSSPDFAPDAVIDRFGQIEPKVLLASASYQYNGKTFDCTERLNEIVTRLPSLSKVVVISSEHSRHTTFDEWVSPHEGSEEPIQRFDFNHPGFVLFSSGTTGKPKCIVHSAAGILLKLSAEYRFQLDLTENDRVFFYTTCGWMMWNWLAFVLSTGATIVLYDGAPMFPNHERLFEIAEDEGLTFLGVSAKFIDTCHKENFEPKTAHDLSALRIIGSTGSVLSPESFDYVYSSVKEDVQLVSMSGGTDICGCFMMGVPTKPVFRGELQGACLGLAMEVFDEHGKPAAVGEKGELVCLAPFPSKPVGFWGDENNEKYRAAYFNGFPEVWTHGDFASKTPNGGFILHGRSDATLNSKGVRIGTAEIYRIVEALPEIEEAMAVSQDWEGDTRVVLFVILRKGFQLTDALVKTIKNSLRLHASPRHVPDKIIAAPALPRTKSNKLVELAVTQVINGRPVKNRDVLANAGALDWFEDLEQLRS